MVLNKQSNYVDEIKEILALARQKAYTAVNSAMVEAYWLIGKRIVEEEQNGEKRAEYGKKVLENLSHELTVDFGKGFSLRNIRNIRLFYLTFPEFFSIRQTPSAESGTDIGSTLFSKLHWSHFQRVLSVVDPNARLFYLKEAAQNNMYVRMYNDLKKQDSDNPTIGILLCTGTDNVIAKYSVLNDSKHLFSTKYIDYLPTENELKAEIEREKMVIKQQFGL